MTESPRAGDTALAGGQAAAGAEGEHRRPHRHPDPGPLDEIKDHQPVPVGEVPMGRSGWNPPRGLNCVKVDEVGTRCDLSDLCDELGGSTDTEFRRVYGNDPPSRELLAYGSLRVLADLSPLVEGHILIVPVQHYLNFGQFIAEHPHDLRNLGEVVLPAYRHLYGDATYLEHGSSSDMRQAACINHAHLHVLPLKTRDVVTSMRADGLEEVRLSKIEDLALSAGDDLPYYLASNAQSGSVFGLGKHMPKQYLRAVAARLLGIEDGSWDWALHIRKEVCRQTVSNLRSVLDQTR